MIKAKYIMLERMIGTAPQRIPVIFFEPLTHMGMWETMQRSREIRGAEIVSAGFAHFNKEGKVSCSGESESLKTRGLPCRPLSTDSDTIYCYNYLHGLV